MSLQYGFARSAPSCGPPPPTLPPAARLPALSQLPGHRTLGLMSSFLSIFLDYAQQSTLLYVNSLLPFASCRNAPYLLNDSVPHDYQLVRKIDARTHMVRVKCQFVANFRRKTWSE